jgi:hypothetical protein
MKLLDDAQIAADAEKRAGYRLRGVTTKLSPSEVDSVERLARSRGLQRGELIRKLILDELARDSGSVPASTELTEIMGIRLMLTNLFRPLATGQKLTPEAFDNMVAEVKKRKRIRRRKELKYGRRLKGPVMLTPKQFNKAVSGDGIRIYAWDNGWHDAVAFNRPCHFDSYTCRIFILAKRRADLYSSMVTFEIK